METPRKLLARLIMESADNVQMPNFGVRLIFDSHFNVRYVKAEGRLFAPLSAARKGPRSRKGVFTAYVQRPGSRIKQTMIILKALTGIGLFHTFRRRAETH